MLRFLVAFVLCLVMGAMPAIVPAALGQNVPAAIPPVADEKPPIEGPKPVAYRCASDRTFSVVYKGGEEADLVMGTKTYTLKQQRAASGFRYTDGTLTLIGKGQEATLEGTPVGALHHCLTQDRL
ncbi:MAG: MliC family protein [Reyranellaceae bacterium]